MIIVQTPRAIVRHATRDDAAFILKLVNEPGWLRFIGDRDVHDLDAARAYIDERLLVNYDKLGFGMYVVNNKASNTPIGLMGFVKRETLDAPDIGYAVSETQQGKGYAFEVCSALINYGWSNLGFDKLYGYCLPDNAPSIRILEKLGMRYQHDQDVNQTDEMCRVYGTTRP